MNGYGQYQPVYNYTGNNQPHYQMPPGYHIKYQNLNEFMNTKNNDNINNLSSEQIQLDIAINQSSYPLYKREIILDFMISNFEGNKDAKVYFTFKEKEKLFVIEYVLSVYLLQKLYKINLLIHIPILFPDYPPEIYIEKNSNIGINEYYKNGKIDQDTLKININNFEKFVPQRRNVLEILNAIKLEFDKNFPVFSDKKDNNWEIIGKNLLNKNQVKEVIIKLNTFRNDDQFLNFMKKQIKDIIRKQYTDYKQKESIGKNYEQLRTINEDIKNKAGKLMNIQNNSLLQDLEELKEIRDQLYQCENSISQEIQKISTDNRGLFEKTEEIINIQNKKYFELLIQQKILDDYLVYLRKGYEKKVIDLHHMIDKTRLITREIFNLTYLMKKFEPEN